MDFEMSKSFNHSLIYGKPDQEIENWSLMEPKSNYNLNERRSSVININTDIYQEDYKFSPHKFIPNIKPTTSYSTPTSQQANSSIDPVERIQFLREMEQAREELANFRRNMSGLLKQMDGITTDLDKSADRVSEIDQDLTLTQEVNVNLQVLLEKAVKTQKESDIFASQAIRNIYTDLASIVHENGQLQERISSIESQQKSQEGNVHDVISRMYEYTEMLEQAQGTIHMLQEPRVGKLASVSSSNSTSRRTSIISFYDDDASSMVSTSTTNISQKKTNNYIQSPVLSPQLTTPIIKPQQGLKMLFDNLSSSQLGLSSIAQKK